jgi:hypothetical protein
MRELCPADHPYVPIALWLDYEAAVAERNAEGLREIAAKLREPRAEKTRPPASAKRGETWA